MAFVTDEAANVAIFHGLSLEVLAVIETSCLSEPDLIEHPVHTSA